MAIIEIEYCHSCGFLERALSVQEATLRALAPTVEAATLAVGDHGVFVVRVDGEIVFDVTTDTFDVDAIVRAVRRACDERSR